MTGALHPDASGVGGMAVAFLATLGALVVLNRLAPWLELVDHPDGGRKRHGTPVPLTGGLAILCGLWIGADAFGVTDANLPKLALLGLVVALHVLDDRRSLPPVIRLAADAVLALAFVQFVGGTIDSLGELGGAALPLGALALPFTVFVYLALTNAFNMVDGVDGLAASQILISILMLGLWRAGHGVEIALTPLTLSTMAAAAAVLLANLGALGQPHRCFLGDSGSRLLGFFLVALLIAESGRTLPPIAALFLVALPALDMAAVAVERMRAGLNPMAGDERHLHHLLIRAGLDHKMTVVVMGLGALLLASVPFVLERLALSESPAWVLLAIVAALYGRYRRPLAEALGTLYAPERARRLWRRRKADPESLLAESWADRQTTRAVPRAAAPRIIAVNRFYWPDRSATSQLLGDLACHLARAGTSVHVVASRAPTDGVLPHRREQAEGVTVHRVWSPSFGPSLPGRALAYLAFYMSGSWQLIWLVRPGDALLVKTDPPLMSVPGAVVAFLRRSRLVLWHQDLFPEVAEAVGVLPPDAWTARRARQLRDWSLAHADRHVAISRPMAARLAERGVPRGRISVIENWSYDDLRPVPPAENPIRQAWNLEGRLVLGYSGNLGRAHQAERVAELVRRTVTIPGLAWIFIGGGVGLARIEALRDELGEAAIGIEPHQPRERLSESLSVPDLHLVSLDPACEGLVMPSKLYGIMAVARPVLNLGATDGSVGSKLARTGIGWTLDADPASWRGTVERLARDRAALLEAGHRARHLHEEAHHSAHRLAAWQAMLTGTATAEREDAAPVRSREREVVT